MSAKARSPWWIAGLVGMSLLLAALVARSDSNAEAGVRRAPPKEHFKSGGERSEALLSEILAALQRMDERMGRIEKHVEQVAHDLRQEAQAKR